MAPMKILAAGSEKKHLGRWQVHEIAELRGLPVVPAAGVLKRHMVNTH